MPPHSAEAEQAVLGCVMLSPGTCLGECQEWFRGENPFYDVRHLNIFAGMEQLHREGVEIDAVTLLTKLRERGQLEDCGGTEYLMKLEGTTPSAANLRYYLEILWEKFLARKFIRDTGNVQRTIMDLGGINEATLGEIKRGQEEFDRAQLRGEITPQFLKTAADFQEGFFQQFFGGESETPGAELPIPFPMKVRRREMTLVSGDDGSGKSTLLSYFALHLAAAGEKVLVASLEMPPAVSLWILASQLIGAKRQPDAPSAHARIASALGWLNKHFLFYDFTGIADWRDLLNTFAYASSKRGMTVAILDSVMRVGIPDDDYAQQGLAAARFAQGAKDGGYHLFTVIHENKGGQGKEKVRGSKLWTANVDNILSVQINRDKGEKADKLAWQIANEKIQKKPDQAEIADMEKKLVAMRQDWDTQLTLRKQRYPGTRQNGSKRFWFDSECFQFRARWDESAVNWLDQWKGKKTES